ncbi:MAG: hypothetical protein ABH956_01035 [Candidatus Nealsonbacteria bacterium]
MTKKVFDIIPSDKKNIFHKKQEVFEYEKKEPNQEIKLSNNPKNKLKKNIFKTLVFSFVFLILIGVFGFFIFSKTEIEIWPKTEILTLKKQFVIDLEEEELDIENGIIPGKIFSNQKTGFQDFFSSGESLKKGKAKGIIKVYNEYSTSDQGLLKNTRFVSVDGKLFKSVKKETIPGGKYENGKLIPGEIDIEIEAAEVGDEYNIEPSTFSIPGFAGTVKYTSFYGKSFSPMKGGFEGEIPQVVQSDLDKSRSILKEKLEKESFDFLKTALPTGFILLDETIFQEIVEEKYSEEVGSSAEAFNLNMKIESSGVIFKKSDMEDFSKNLINLNIEENKKFQEESLDINYFIESNDRGEDKSQVVLNIEIKVKVYQDIDLDALKKILLGKSFQEVETSLDDKFEIIKTEIKPGPFWIKKMPEDMDKVEIKLNID